MRYGVIWTSSFGAALAMAWSLGLAGVLQDADRALVAGLHDLAAVETTEIVLVVTDLGGMAVVPWLCALVAVMLAWRREWAGACAVVVSVLATQAMVALIKGAVGRPRPGDSDALVHAAGHTFPSGHAATAAALYGALVLVACDRLTGRTRAFVAGAALAVAAAIGASRVYLGAHYPSDVLAGWLLGAAIAAAAYGLARRLRARTARRPAFA